MSIIRCNCGRRAIYLIADVGWLCKDCFDEQKKKSDSIKKPTKE